MTINLHLPTKTETLRPTITVIGVGGAGGNAVNNMIAAKLEGVNFVMANTDAQALDNALTDRVIQLGSGITRGLGAGAQPEIGRAAAEEAMEEIAAYIHGSNMVFITAGMGGGTGTGAAPVVARAAREQGILTVGVVTKPFQFEGSHRMKLAEAGLQELQQYVDTLIVIPNQNLFRIANEKTTFADAFKMADEVLHSGVRGVTDLMVKPGLVNLDFADIRTVMREMGKAMMGTGEATGERRAIDAAEAAISNPLLDDVSLKGAKAVLINITGGLDMTLFEVDEAANRIRDEVDPEANIIFGSTFNEVMDGRMRVSVVATGIDSAASQRPTSNTTTAAPAEPKKPFSISMPPRAAAPKAEPPRMSKPMAQPMMSAAPRVMSDPRSAEKAPPRDSFEFTDAPAPVEATYSGHQAALNFSEAEETVTRITPVEAAPAIFANTAPAQAAAAPRAQFVNRPVEEYQPYGALPAQKRDIREDNSPALSFFQKMAGVGRALSTRSEAEMRPMQVSEKKPEMEKAPAAAEEAYLDIPAFLRRQAN